MTDAATIDALEDARLAAMVKGDWDALAALLADDLTYVHTSGRVHGKPDLIAYLQSTVEFIDAQRSHASVRAYDDYAILTGEVVNQTRVRQTGQDFAFRARVLLVWRRDAEGWRLAAYQGVRLDG